MCDISEFEENEKKCVLCSQLFAILHSHTQLTNHHTTIVQSYHFQTIILSSYQNHTILETYISRKYIRKHIRRFWPARILFSILNRFYVHNFLAIICSRLFKRTLRELYSNFRVWDLYYFFYLRSLGLMYLTPILDYLTPILDPDRHRNLRYPESSPGSPPPLN